MMKNYYTLFTMLKPGFILTALMISLSGNGQEIIRSTIGAIGISTTNEDGISLFQTAGQSSNTSLFDSPEISLRQGFQQPPLFNGLSERLEMIDFDLYPNPNQGKFYLQVNSTLFDKFNYQIYDALGKLIESGQANANAEQLINHEKINPGMYFIKLVVGEQVVGQKKFIVYL
jgi:hypothetical protein